MARFVNDQAVLRRGGGPFRPFADPATLRALLFSASEPGFTFEPWDMTTLYQDRAGATPVTAVGQSVGLRLSKDQGLVLGAELVASLISDNMWVQLPATPNSLVSGDQLTFGGQFSGRKYAVNATNPNSRYEFRFNARRISGNATISFFHEGSQTGAASPLTLTDTVSSYVIRPQGAAGGDLVSFGFQDRNASGFGTVEVTNISVRELAGNHEVAINDAARGVYGREPEGGTRNLLNATATLSTQSVTVTAVAHTLAFTGTGTVTLSGVSTAGPLVGTGAGNRVTLTFTPTAGSLTLTVTGSVTLAQLQIGSVDTAYQAVVSQYDITEAGVPSCYYVQTDGVDDAYVTPTITPGTDKAQIFMAIKKLNDTGGILMELSASAGPNAGTFYALSGTDTGPLGSVNGYSSLSRGSAAATALQTAQIVQAAPDYAVICATHDIAGDLSTVMRNGVAGTNGTADKGTGGFLAYPVYGYARGGTTLPVAVRDYGHVLRFGPNLAAATIARVNSYLSRNLPTVTL